MSMSTNRASGVVAVSLSHVLLGGLIAVAIAAQDRQPVGRVAVALVGDPQVAAHDGLHAAAIAAVGGLLLYIPVYWMIDGTASLAKAAWTDIALQALVQGLLTATISYLLYGRAVSILGASSGAAFAALCPAMTALMAIPVLGEWPGVIDWLAIIAISAGVYIVSGGPLAGRWARSWGDRPLPKL